MKKIIIPLLSSLFCLISWQLAYSQENSDLQYVRIKYTKGITEPEMQELELAFNLTFMHQCEEGFVQYNVVLPFVNGYGETIHTTQQLVTQLPYPYPVEGAKPGPCKPTRGSIGTLGGKIIQSSMSSLLETVEELKSMAKKGRINDTLLKTTNDSSIPEKSNLLKDKYSVYPNPFIASIQVVIPAKEKEVYSVALITITGQTLIKNKIIVNGYEQVISLDLAAIPSGTYILSIKSNTVTQYKKIMKL